MGKNGFSGRVHSAEATALGFYYQTYYALLALTEQTTDDAAVGIEQLDDVVIEANGQTLLSQLKHSISTVPPPITLKSRAFWRTVKVWADLLPSVTLSETSFHLVVVSNIPSSSPLNALTAPNTDRAKLVKAMTEEAQRVLGERVSATKDRRVLPHSDRFDGCEAFLRLTETEKLNLMRRTVIRQNSPAVDKIENIIAEHLNFLPSGQRPIVAKRLIEWLERQIVYSLCGKRDRLISRIELQQQIMAIVADIEQEKLIPHFETVSPPEDYQPDGMLARQIKLVEGKPSDLQNAIREEWKAREQRSNWLNANPGLAVIINDYDLVLTEHWSDRHKRMVEDCVQLDHTKKCESGLKILRWTHDDAPNHVRPIAQGWDAAYYVRGSYQVLAINLSVGWHPEFNSLLESKE